MGAYEHTPTVTIQYTLATAKSGSGVGSISSLPAGIDCSITCTGTADCIVTMDAEKVVTALFEQKKYKIYLPLIIRYRQKDLSGFACIPDRSKHLPIHCTK
ncbi:MAG: hypothetical protein ACI9EW_001832 [Cellvibrionaceae bacterium]|jgi:hypothetical protein